MGKDRGFKRVSPCSCQGEPRELEKSSNHESAIKNVSRVCYPACSAPNLNPKGAGLELGMAAGSPSAPSCPPWGCLFIPTAFHSKFLEYPGAVSLATSRLSIRRGSGSLPRTPRVKESRLAARSRFLFTTERQTRAPPRRCVLNAFSSH